MPEGDDFSENTPPVEVRHLNFSYGKKREPALRDIVFSLRQGELTGLLGPNGSGKSTLLRCIAGLLSPDALLQATPDAAPDTIKDEEKNEQRSQMEKTQRFPVVLSGLPAARLRDKERARMLAYLPQRPSAPPGFSAFSLTLMGRYAHSGFTGGYSEVDEEIARQAMLATDVWKLAARNAATLSGGELQRVFLARALAQEAPLLLLDEATAGLDPACRTDFFLLLRERIRAQGISALAAMHDLNLAALHCRRLIFLKKGRVVADGPVDEVFTRAVLEEVYETPFVMVEHPDTGIPQALPATRQDFS